MNKKWYTNGTAYNAHDQGLVIEEKTGETIAVTYKQKNARLIAAAPELLEACRLALAHLQVCDDYHDESATAGAKAIAAIEEAIQKAKG